MSRSLPSVASSDLVKASFSLNILGADSLTTYQFSAQDIINISALSFEVPFGGGLGKPSTYNVTLGSSLGWIKANRRNLVGADVRLSVHVNSDVFQPHRGRVRGIELDGADVNQVKLSIYDRFLDTNPLLPVEAIVDSWSTPHLEHLNDGYPLFYGNVSSRFIYFTAVTSNAGLFLGPRNIDSYFHSKVINNNLKEAASFYTGDSQNSFAFISTSFGWNQQSGSDNLFLVGCEGFIVTDVSVRSSSTLGPYTVRGPRFYNLQDTTQSNSEFNGFNNGAILQFPVANTTSLLSFDISVRPEVIGTQEIQFVSQAALTRTFSVFAAIGGASFQSSIDNTINSKLSWDSRSAGLGGTQDRGTLGITYSGSTAANNVYFAVRLALVLDGSIYQRNSVFVIPASASIPAAISANPLAILDHISSFQSGIPYRQDQSSAAQVLVQSWQFNGYVGPERVRLGTLLDDFASTVGFYAWAGDSGMVQYRVYQESGAATVDRIVGPNDFLEAPTFKTNPLGITLYNSQLANKFSLDWNFTFHTGQFGNTTVAGAPNVSFCVSATAAGIQKEIRDQSKWIIDPDTASYAMGHMVRINGQGQEYVDMRLPARFFTVEPADVLQVQHPSIVGSAALYQVVRADPDYLNGNVKITAGKLLDLTNPAV